MAELTWVCPCNSCTKGPKTGHSAPDPASNRWKGIIISLNLLATFLLKQGAQELHCHVGTLWTSGPLGVHQEPQVLFCKAASQQPVISLYWSLCLLLHPRCRTLHFLLLCFLRLPLTNFFSSVMSPCIAVKAPVHPMLPSVGYHPHITGVPPIPPPRALMKLLSPIHLITNSQGVSDFSSLTFNHSSPDNFPITLYSTSPHPGYSYVTSLA